MPARARVARRSRQRSSAPSRCRDPSAKSTLWARRDSLRPGLLLPLGPPPLDRTRELLWLLLEERRRVGEYPSNAHGTRCRTYARISSTCCCLRLIVAAPP